MAGLFRRSPIVQLQVRPGSFGTAGDPGLPGAQGPAGPAGSQGSAALGPTEQTDLTSPDINALFTTPIDVIDAVADAMVVPILFWTEQNVTVAGTNACAYNWSYPTGADLASFSATLNSARNAGNRDLPNQGSVNSAFGTPLPVTGVPFQVSLSVTPTGPPVVTARVFILYFVLPMLIT